MSTNHTPDTGNGRSSDVPPLGTTFDYEVRLEWGPAVERHTMNRIAQIIDYVAAKLAEMGVVDAEETPEPNIARITIERCTGGEEDES